MSFLAGLKEQLAPHAIELKRNRVEDGKGYRAAHRQLVDTESAVALRRDRGGNARDRSCYVNLASWLKKRPAF